MIITQGNVTSIRINLSRFEIAMASEKLLDAVQILYLWDIVGGTLIVLDGSSESFIVFYST